MASLYDADTISEILSNSHSDVLPAETKLTLIGQFETQ